MDGTVSINGPNAQYMKMDVIPAVIYYTVYNYILSDIAVL